MHKAYSDLYDLNKYLVVRERDTLMHLPQEFLPQNAVPHVVHTLPTC